jgi:hypothetical protein
VLCRTQADRANTEMRIAVIGTSGGQDNAGSRNRRTVEPAAYRT